MGVPDRNHSYEHWSGILGVSLGLGSVNAPLRPLMNNMMFVTVFLGEIYHHEIQGLLV